MSLRPYRFSLIRFYTSHSSKQIIAEYKAKEEDLSAKYMDAIEKRIKEKEIKDEKEEEKDEKVSKKSKK